MISWSVDISNNNIQLNQQNCTSSVKCSQVNKRSKDEGEHCFSSLGVCLLELFQVASVLLFGPLGHLHDRHHREDVGCVVSGQKGVDYPAQCLPEVVGAGDLVETVAVGDLALFCLVFVLPLTVYFWSPSKVSQNFMAFVIHIFEKSPQRYEQSDNFFRVGVSRGKHVQLNCIQQSEEYPVVSTVNENSLKGHRLSAKNVDISRLVLSFQVVQDSHHQSSALNGCIQLSFAKSIEQRENDDGPEVLDVKYIGPSYLPSQIFEVQTIAWNLYEFQSFLIISENCFDLSIFVGELLLYNWYFSLIFELLFDPAYSVGLVGADNDVSVFILDSQVDGHILKNNNQIIRQNTRVKFTPIKIQPVHLRC